MGISMKLQRIVNSFLRCVMASIIAVLLLHSMFSTSFIDTAITEGTYYEHSENIPDDPVLHLVVFAAVILLLMAGRRVYRCLRERNVCKGLKSWHILCAGCVILSAAAAWFILATQLRPGSDPAKVYTIAMQWREHDFSAFEQGEYLFRYPFQSGIVLYYYVLSFLFGIDNYVGIQLANAAALVLLYLFLAGLAGLYWKTDKKIQGAVYLVLMTCSPLFFYITYLYGILPGTVFSLAAVYLAIKYLEAEDICLSESATHRQGSRSNRCKDAKHLFLLMAGASLCIGVATVLKMNCLIYAVAIGCFLFYDILNVDWRKWRQKRLWIRQLRSLLFIGLMVLAIAGCNGVVNRYVEHLSGHELAEGEVMVSWVVMGIQDAPLGPGSYNGYNGEVFERNGYDTEKITQESLAEIKKILKKMAENPLDEGVTFFARKDAFQWNEPSFTGMYLNDYRRSAVTIPETIQSMINGRGRVMLMDYFNQIQTIVFLGALCYVFLHWKSRNLYELFGGVVFIGGYLFHFFWEASSSYTVPYYVVLMPYAVKGCLDLSRKLDDGMREVAAVYREQGGFGRTAAVLLRRAAAWGKKRRFAVCATVLLFVLLLLFMQTNLFHRTIALDDGEEMVSRYYHWAQQGED